MQKLRNFILGATFLALGVTIWAINHNQQNPTTTAGAPLAKVILPDHLSQNAQKGEIAFTQYCVSCHGVNAAGQDGIAPPLVHIYYEPNHHGDMAFLSAMARGVQAHHWPFGNMPPVEGITREEADDIIVYIRELQRANGIE